MNVIDRTISAAAATMTGCRELEQIIFKLKGRLWELRLGDFIWDDYIVFVAELCRELEVVELNSQTVSDAAVLHMLKRSEHLTTLDVAGLKTFSGIAFQEVN